MCQKKAVRTNYGAHSAPPPHLEGTGSQVFYPGQGHLAKTLSNPGLWLYPQGPLKRGGTETRMTVSSESQRRILGTPLSWQRWQGGDAGHSKGGEQGTIAFKEFNLNSFSLTEIIVHLSAVINNEIKIFKTQNLVWLHKNQIYNIH